MGFTTLERMKSALLTTTVTSLERAVLLDMAIAVDDDAPLYTWGHDRLALAIGKTPGTPAAKQALSVRILPSLISKGLIRKRSAAHRGHRAEYELLVLGDPGMGNGSRSGMGNGFDDDVSRVTHGEHGMGNGSEGEWVTVSEGMGNAQTVTPLPISLPPSPTGKRIARAARRPSDRQMVFASDIAHLLDVAAEPQTSAEAAEFIRENWPEIERRAHNGEPFDCSIADLSPATRRYARERGLLLNDERTTA
ncbi:hypothetical protein FVO59_14215 [Microbacterium esteraromaticum]|uniref:Uncharacterized protein n=1 Tax=Microbacterium esteraromaticum TaxID=57043 RepID=A0A7D7WJV2_9MICO|nr:hypothetical protein [Microbacterium esteraromaticum]QMU98210.1 hypothetical protein FVO59_14215 [Microbacterium esteraromaticum]